MKCGETEKPDKYPSAIFQANKGIGAYCEEDMRENERENPG